MYEKTTVYANIVHLLTKRTKQVVTISGYDIGVLNTITNIFAIIKEYLLYCDKFYMYFNLFTSVFPVTRKGINRCGDESEWAL